MNDPEESPLQRTDLMDTSYKAHRRLIGLLRKMRPETKVRRCFEMNESLRAIRRAAQAYERLADRRDL